LVRYRRFKETDMKTAICKQAAAGLAAMALALPIMAQTLPAPP